MKKIKNEELEAIITVQVLIISHFHFLFLLFAFIMYSLEKFVNEKGSSENVSMHN